MSRVEGNVEGPEKPTRTSHKSFTKTDFKKNHNPYLHQLKFNKDSLKDAVFKHLENHRFDVKGNDKLDFLCNEDFSSSAVFVPLLTLITSREFFFGLCTKRLLST
ncbi:hypothetical protein AC249_AIPGENE28895 [Exaiptasia diaphana]|nr:hypothetical protein AC249_AIPGENE28895 [Exaiptasia diaphana]